MPLRPKKFGCLHKNHRKLLSFWAIFPLWSKVGSNNSFEFEKRFNVFVIERLQKQIALQAVTSLLLPERIREWNNLCKVSITIEKFWFDKKFPNMKLDFQVETKLKSFNFNSSFNSLLCNSNHIVCFSAILNKALFIEISQKQSSAETVFLTIKYVPCVQRNVNV